ncbi:Subtilisin-like protease [Neolecta irregularis DAH-3]|uniref:Subtilisin-like protease n=1 Tax=Neolecta irregularis (strain DAH-3) TaxID=1198029 RepID=A0A1U7LSG3_NEOID|nr:Subtilisin-like protease [Neolecta irregularis DAH-3]|eukprot:OLL25616.1 Subtilisin-like protease [Neolecta irregularis DAH-3]
MKFSATPAAITVLAVSIMATPMLRTPDEAAPLLFVENGQAVPNSYIVVFKEDIDLSATTDHHNWLNELHESSLKKRGLQMPFGRPKRRKGVKHTYAFEKFRAYSGEFDQDTIEYILRHPDIAYVEQDSEVHTLEWKGSVEEDMEFHTMNTQRNSPWGLARICHRESLGFSTFNKYHYNETAGEGIDVYVIDTGVNIHHDDFEGRALWGATIPELDDDIDGNGHGTHCSGTIGGRKYGIAKKANIIAVKVLRTNGSGSMADVLKGVEWAAKSHISKVNAAKKKGMEHKGSVANMSLGGGKSQTLNLAVDAAVEAGIFFAVAAGNENTDACLGSPSSASKPVVVGASTLGDERAYFSNYGKCVDIYAPGLNILSTWIGSKDATNTISGTSMASPHIAGLMAYLLSMNPGMTPEQMKKLLVKSATRDILESIPKNTPNLLAFNGFKEPKGGKRTTTG